VYGLFVWEACSRQTEISCDFFSRLLHAALYCLIYDGSSYVYLHWAGRGKENFNDSGAMFDVLPIMNTSSECSIIKDFLDIYIRIHCIVSHNIIHWRYVLVTNALGSTSPALSKLL
jgi:hypothetical protein